MIFFIIATILLIYKGLLAGKDASSYLLKNQVSDDFTNIRIKRWHRDGVLLDIMFTLTLAYATGNYVEVILQSLLIRVAFFDVMFNYWANLSIYYLGSTAAWDKIFVRIFGLHGAITKSLVFLGVLIGWGIIKLIV